MKQTKELKHTIFCIDDDHDDLQMLKEVVESIDGRYSLIEAHDGLDGIRELNSMKDSGDLPCLIVLDINMPRMDGKTTFMNLKSDALLSKIPIVIFSTSSSPLDKMFFAKENVAYFTKPINFRQLTEVASKMLSFCKS